MTIPPAQVLVITGATFEARLAEGDGVSVICSGANVSKLHGLLRNIDPSRYRAVISFGLAGGLDPALRAGDLIVAAHVKTKSETWRTTPSITQALTSALGIATAPERSLAGSDMPIMKHGDKAVLFETAQACAVDMESHVAASFAHAHNLPWGVLRVVCDPAHRTLPSLVFHALGPDGDVNTSAVLKSVAQNPAQIPALIKLGWDTAFATAALRRARRLLGPGFGLTGLVGTHLG